VVGFAQSQTLKYAANTFEQPRFNLQIVTERASIRFIIQPFLLTIGFSMFLDTLLRLIALHAGTPVAVSQATLSLMFVVLGMILIGISLGIVTKTKEKLLQHRWVLSAAIALTLGAIFFVMIPAAFSFYIDPDLEFFSAISFTTLIHGVIGVPAITTALIYAFGDLPQHVRKWMRITAVLWIADLGLGVVLFVQMMGLI
jgi:uncharacterized membrane protein YozB (DUF420 family)